GEQAGLLNPIYRVSPDAPIPDRNFQIWKTDLFYADFMDKPEAAEVYTVRGHE
ncbi:MAG: hypothetical protein JWM11_6435, partial [Planctomycetaceae bacterium]|nr:hypothetical protein [Planctomycetaceae bacterium]